MKALLVATLQRLEAVDRVVARADDSNAALEQRVNMLEEERNLALQDASSAKSRVEALKKSQRRVEWQNKVCSTPPLLKGGLFLCDVLKGVVKVDVHLCVWQLHCSLR